VTVRRVTLRAISWHSWRHQILGRHDIFGGYDLPSAIPPDPGICPNKPSESAVLVLPAFIPLRYGRAPI
jgi:hypothetical protein